MTTLNIYIRNTNMKHSLMFTNNGMLGMRPYKLTQNNYHYLQADKNMDGSEMKMTLFSGASSQM